MNKVLSDERLGAKLRVTENRCVIFNHSTYVYIYIYIYIYKIRSSKANFFKAAINDNVNNPRIYWHHLNTLIKGKNVQQHITLQVENNELTSDPNKVAKAFNLALVNIAQKYIDEGPPGYAWSLEIEVFCW